MHFKKRLLAAAAVIAMAVAVIYGSTQELSADGVVESPLAWFNRKETIYFWYSDESLSDFVSSAAVSFGEKENVRVIPVLAEGSEYLEALNQASLHSGQVPDAYIISHDSLEKAYLAGLATQVQDAENVCSAEKFPKAALAAVSYQGKTVAYPLFFETSALVYNETYLLEWAAQRALAELTQTEEGAAEGAGEEALVSKTEEYFRNSVPATVDDILNIAKTFDLPEGVEGIMKWDVTDIFYNYWFVGNYMNVGGDAGDDDNLIQIHTNETIQCLDVYKALNQFFYIESDTVTYDSVLRDFMDGKIVFTIATTDVVKRLADAKAQGEIAFDYGVALLPDVSGELKSRSMSVTNAVAVNGYSRHKELANRFAAYLADTCADSLYERTGKVSASLRADADNAALQVFKQEYADSIPLPKMMETGNFWMQLESLFSKVWNGADATELLRELANQIVSQINALE